MLPPPLVFGAQNPRPDREYPSFVFGFRSFLLLWTKVAKKLRGTFAENRIKNSKEKLVQCNTEGAPLYNHFSFVRTIPGKKYIL